MKLQLHIHSDVQLNLVTSRTSWGSPIFKTLLQKPGIFDACIADNPYAESTINGLVVPWVYIDDAGASVEWLIRKGHNLVEVRS